MIKDNTKATIFQARLAWDTQAMLRKYSREHDRKTIRYNSVDHRHGSIRHHRVFRHRVRSVPY